MLELTVRRKNIISGLIALVLLISTISIGVESSFGVFDDVYVMKASFDAAGQGLQKNSDVKIRGVNIGKVEYVKLVDGRALVVMDIKRAEKVPTSAQAIVRPKTLFGEKFVDLVPGDGEAAGPYYATDGSAMIPNDKTLGGFELEKVLGEAYPLLQAIKPSELATVLGTLADSANGLGPTINRTLVNGQKVADVLAKHDADTRQFLADIATISKELSKRSDDLVGLSKSLNVALPTINGHADELTSLLVQTGRLSGDVADLLEGNKAFADNALGVGDKVIQLLYDRRGDVMPLIVGVRQYVQVLSELIRIPVGDGTYMAAVKAVLGGDACGVITCNQAPGPITTAVPGAAAPAAASPAGNPTSEALRALFSFLGGLGGAKVTRTAVKFGIFVLVCIFFTGYLAFTIGNISFGDPLGRDYYKMSATFDDVTGLLPNDNVKIAGVVVGKVVSIKVDHGRARVSFRVENSYKLPDDSSVQIRWRNLIGQRYLYLNPGTSTTSFRDGAAVNDSCTGSVTTHCTTSVVDLGELFNRLGPIVQAIDPHQVNDFIDTVSQALEGNTDKLSKAIDDLAVLAKALATRDETIGHLVTNLNAIAGTITNRDQQIRVMLDNLVLISKTFSDNTATLDNALTQFGRFSTSLNSVLTGNKAELDRIISNLALVTNDVVAPRLATLNSALKGIDITAQRIFTSSSLGEWLNQSILCAGVQPPTAGLPGNCTGLGPILGTTTSPGILATNKPAAAIGNNAASNNAGANALVQLLTGGAK